MLGAEAVGVVGIIAMVTQMLDGNIKFVERIDGFTADVKDAPNVKDIPETVRGLPAVLPLLRHTLQRTERNASFNHLDEKTAQAVRPVIEACQQELAKLVDLFAQVVPEEGSSKIGVVWKAFCSLRIDEEVEEIAASIARCVQSLTIDFPEAARFSLSERSLLSLCISKLAICAGRKSASALRDDENPSMAQVPDTGESMDREQDLANLQTQVDPALALQNPGKRVDGNGDLSRHEFHSCTARPIR